MAVARKSKKSPKPAGAKANKQKQMTFPGPKIEAFSIIPHMRERFDEVDQKLSYDVTDPKKHRAWRNKLAKKVKEITGYSTMKSCELNARVTETKKVGKLIRRRIEIDTEPGVTMPFYELRLAQAEGPAVPVICCHGHGSGGKYSTAGRSDIPKIRKQIKNFNYDYGVKLAEAGYITFCPDARGFGERQEWNFKHELLAASCAYLNAMAYPLGQTVTGMWAWDLSRLIDYIETRDDCHSDRLACVGLSGGGLQTLWVSALDERVKAAVVSGYFYGYKESLLDKLCCFCNYVPHLYEYADIGDIGALIAPRPLLIETGDEDPLNGESNLKNVRSQVKQTRKAYKTLDASSNLKHVVFNGPHMWNGEKVPAFLKKHVGV